jgi:hypothetical protein
MPSSIHPSVSGYGGELIRQSNILVPNETIGSAGYPGIDPRSGTPWPALLVTDNSILGLPSSGNSSSCPIALSGSALATLWYGWTKMQLKTPFGSPDVVDSDILDITTLFVENGGSIPFPCCQASLAFPHSQLGTIGFGTVYGGGKQSAAVSLNLGLGGVISDGGASNPLFYPGGGAGASADTDNYGDIGVYTLPDYAAQTGTFQIQDIDGRPLTPLLPMNGKGNVGEFVLQIIQGW